MPAIELTHLKVREPRAGSGVVRIDPLRFLAGCLKRRLNQALSVLSVSIGFCVYIVVYKADFCVNISLCLCMICLLAVAG